MATKSIMKEVCFKDNKLCRGLATALESASGTIGKDVKPSQACKSIPKDKIKDFFAER